MDGSVSSSTASIFPSEGVLGHTKGGVLLFIGGGFIPRGGIGIATGGDCISDPEPTAGK